MLVQMGIYGNLSQESAIYKEFMDGGLQDPKHQVTNFDFNPEFM